jgi:hypothetical protein
MSALKTISEWSHVPKELIFADIERYESGIALLDIGDLIIELIDVFPDYDRAERLAVSAAERHVAEPAYLVSDHLFDTTGPRPDDKAWLKYVLLGIKANSNTMYDFDISHATRAIENECGVWFPGHVKDIYYYVGLAGNRDIVTNTAKVVRAYCQKIGDHYRLREEEGPDTFPITTTFDESVVREVYER